MQNSQNCGLFVFRRGLVSITKLTCILINKIKSGLFQGIEERFFKIWSCRCKEQTELQLLARQNIQLCTLLAEFNEFSLCLLWLLTGSCYSQRDASELVPTVQNWLIFCFLDLMHVDDCSWFYSRGEIHHELFMFPISPC